LLVGVEAEDLPDVTIRDLGATCDVDAVRNVGAGRSRVDKCCSRRCQRLLTGDGVRCPCERRR